MPVRAPGAQARSEPVEADRLTSGCRCGRPTSCSSTARSRARSRGARIPVRDAVGRARSPGRCRRRARTCATRCAPRARAQPKWAALDRVPARSGALPRRRDDGRARRAARGRAAACSASDRPMPRRGGRGRDRSVGLVRGLGRQDRADRRHREPRRGPVLRLHRAGSRSASSVSSRPTNRRCSASCRSSRPRCAQATRSSCSRPETNPLVAITLAEILATSDLPGRGRQRADRRQGRDRAVARRRTATSTRSTSRARPTSSRPRWNAPRPTT